MCSSPILIKNPYHNNGHLKDTFNGKGIFLKINKPFDFLHDTRSAYISVPCGQCKQCVSTRQNFYLQRIQMESLYSELFFFTLTYSDRGLCYTDINVYKIPYPNYFDIQAMFKRVRKVLPHPIKTLVVSEYGSKRSRPHFHGLLAISRDDIKTYYRNSISYCEHYFHDLLLKNWIRNTSKSHKYPVYMKLCDYIRKGRKSTFDFHWVAPLSGHDNDVSYYVTKYILKYDSRIQKLLYKIRKDSLLSDKETKQLILQLKPRCVLSKDFGSYKLSKVSEYIKKCLSKNSDYPSYYDINTGKSMLMSIYYRKRFIDLQYRFDKYWEWLLNIQYKNVDCDPNSYEPDLLIDTIIHDSKIQSFRKRQEDSKFRKIKYHVSKK